LSAEFLADSVSLLPPDSPPHSWSCSAIRYAIQISCNVSAHHQHYLNMEGTVTFIFKFGSCLFSQNNYSYVNSDHIRLQVRKDTVIVKQQFVFQLTQKICLAIHYFQSKTIWRSKLRSVVNLALMNHSSEIHFFMKTPDNTGTYKGMVWSDMSKPALIFFHCKSTHNKIHCQNFSC
jgi:hypothetical protein